MMRIIGLTGGIASGKSTVARLLEELGGVVIDADRLSREAVEPGMPAFNAIIEAFGKDVLTASGAIDRAKLGNIVFADEEKRRLLESITHPAIKRLAEDRLQSLREAGTKVVIYMAPLLIEAGVSGRVDEIWVVYADRETQVKRLMARDGMSREDALRRIESQMPMEEKRLLGKVVIDNRADFEETARQVREIWNSEKLDYL